MDDILSIILDQQNNFDDWTTFRVIQRQKKHYTFKFAKYMIINKKQKKSFLLNFKPNNEYTSRLLCGLTLNSFRLLTKPVIFTKYLCILDYMRGREWRKKLFFMIKKYEPKFDLNSMLHKLILYKCSNTARFIITLNPSINVYNALLTAFRYNSIKIVKYLLPFIKKEELVNKKEIILSIITNEELRIFMILYFGDVIGDDYENNIFDIRVSTDVQEITEEEKFYF
jgi:hypothetical protein